MKMSEATKHEICFDLRGGEVGVVPACLVFFTATPEDRELRAKETWNAVAATAKLLGYRAEFRELKFEEVTRRTCQTDWKP